MFFEIIENILLDKIEKIFICVSFFLLHFKACAVLYLLRKYIKYDDPLLFPIAKNLVITIYFLALYSYFLLLFSIILKVIIVI